MFFSAIEKFDLIFFSSFLNNFFKHFLNIFMFSDLQSTQNLKSNGILNNISTFNRDYVIINDQERGTSFLMDCLLNIFTLNITNFSFYLLVAFFLFFYILYNKGFYFCNFIKIENSSSFYITHILTKFIYSTFIKQLGLSGKNFLSIIFVTFYFILFLNFLGTLPYSFPVTSHLYFTFYLGFIAWFSSFLLGFFFHGIDFLKIFVPTVPKPLLPFLIVIEVMSYLVRVFSLSLRLAANITSGHVLVFTLSSFCIKLWYIGFLFSFVCFIILNLILLLELGVAFLQAYVFVTLYCIYLSEAINFSPDSH